MKAAVFAENGDPEVVRIKELPRPEPGPGQALVEVKAAALNHLDLWVRRGMPIETPMPHIGGSDIAGVVAELGAGGEVESGDAGTGDAPGAEPGRHPARGRDPASARGIKPGTRVVVDPAVGCGRCEWCERGERPLCPDFHIIGEHTQGGFAEYAVAPVENLHPIPDDLPFATAAAAPLTFQTAWRGLITRARLRAGEDVLITGASGGVSTAAIQIAKLAGARVFAVTSTENVERVRELGADHVFDRTTVDYSKALWKATGRRGVDVILDSVGEATWSSNLRALAKAGRLVVYGATTGPAAETELRRVFWNQLEIIGTTMSNRREFAAVIALVMRGELKPVVDVVWPLERASEAHERLEAGEQFGKIVLTP